MSSPVVIFVKLVTKTGETDKIKAIFLDDGTVELSRAEEGCITYDFFQDDHDPEILYLYEVWQSQQHLEAHHSTTHYKNAKPTIDALCEDVTVSHATKL